MQFTVHLPDDDFDDVLTDIASAFRTKEVTITPNKKKKIISLDLPDTMQHVHSTILRICPDTRIEERQGS